jgi:hypothetical protein
MRKVGRRGGLREEELLFQINTFFPWNLPITLAGRIKGRNEE